MVATMANASDKKQLATFAGGCFWCTESDFFKVSGVISVTSGYTGGEEANPTYEQVSSGSTGHAEGVQIVFDPDKVTYKELVDIYWKTIDPTNSEGQFCDIGKHYRTEIFYHDDEQKKIAEETKKQIEESGKLPSAIVTNITKASQFYPAEDYHQDYHKKNPVRYKFYRYSSGRDEKLKELWGE